MSLPYLKKVPQSPVEWETFHFQHYLHHKSILAVIHTKTGLRLFMPPIWPVRDNDWTAKLSGFHQTLHQQMNALSKDNSWDFLHTDLNTRDGQETFINTNYANHFAFDQFVGVPP